ncbi:MAG: cytochrome P460 family protein [Alphaproteobacteria bacterium]|nr:cytochrome P460 family protein [Alphaproteobacteria bacterium]MDP6563422.1 cytochrome P460 family protein [Alphaproteobacteria bacterium]MDP6816360.1 cytochrome P460 family protein [Alphaproteobacteria bacterium]
MRMYGRFFAAALAGLMLLVLPVADGRAENEHLRLESPADMTDAKALEVYQRILPSLTEALGISRDPTATRYHRWTRFNRAPYLSATHGNRFANNYANGTAERGGYGRLQPGQRMPVGSVVVKDSFTVTDQGEVFPGALFFMQKLAAGRSPKTADWRFAQILPDGSFLGDTTGDNADEVAFCFTCHKAMAKRDFLFFVPADYRRR